MSNDNLHGREVERRGRIALALSPSIPLNFVSRLWKPFKLHDPRSSWVIVLIIPSVEPRYFSADVMGDVMGGTCGTGISLSYGSFKSLGGQKGVIPAVRKHIGVAVIGSEGEAEKFAEDDWNTLFCYAQDDNSLHDAWMMIKGKYGRIHMVDRAQQLMEAFRFYLWTRNIGNFGESAVFYRVEEVDEE